jgi:hypothetical protein
LQFWIWTNNHHNISESGGKYGRCICFVYVESSIIYKLEQSA